MDDMTASVTDHLETTMWRELRTHLRARRLALGVSQQALADLIGVEVDGLSRWECGARLPNLWNLLAWTEALGLAFHVVATQHVPKATLRAKLTASTSLQPCPPPLALGRGSVRADLPA